MKLLVSGIGSVPHNLTLRPRLSTALLCPGAVDKEAPGNRPLARFPGLEVVHTDQHDTRSASNKDCTREVRQYRAVMGLE